MLGLVRMLTTHLPLHIQLGCLVNVNDLRLARPGLPLLLGSSQRKVDAFHGHELVVATRLCHHPVLQSENFVALLDRRQSVSNSNTCKRPFHGLTNMLKSLLNFLLAHVVQSTGSFIEEEDLWLSQHRSRDGDALLLTAGKLRAPRAHEGVQALRESFREGHLGEINHFLDVVLCSRRPAIEDVLPDGRRKENWLLPNISDKVANCSRCEASDVLPIDQDCSLSGIVESLEQAHHCALAAATFANESHFLALFDLQGQPLQNLGLRASRVEEVHILQLEARDLGQGRAA
mmetsp:Transcript_3667/g.8538  ORF Transcript_3667/g.8538 Transcript_3667/m.8538 type:complete len:289 (+) Transcript_3667:2173-3039(+)